MQRCIIFFLFLIIGWKASLFAQEKITVDAENRSVGELFLQIEKQSGYTFSYNPSLLKDFPPVTIKIVDGSLERVLDLLFNRTDIQPMVRGRYIILKKRPKEITISGFIYDRGLRRVGEVSRAGGPYPLPVSSGALQREGETLDAPLCVHSPDERRVYGVRMHGCNDGVQMQRVGQDDRGCHLEDDAD